MYCVCVCVCVCVQVYIKPIYHPTRRVKPEITYIVGTSQRSPRWKFIHKLRMFFWKWKKCRMFSVIGRVSVRGWNSLYSIKTMPMENPYKDSKIQCLCVCVFILTM